MIGYLYKYYFMQILFGSIVGWGVLGNLFIAMVSSLVYFFRLTYYVIFDFYKGFKSPFFFLLISKRVLSSTIKFSAPNQVLGVAILFSAAFITGSFFCWFSECLPVAVDYSGDASRAYVSTLSAGVLYFAQYFYFYFLYFVILGVLTTTSWRRNVSAVETIIAFTACIFIFLL
jgi:hypothetical protein